MVIYNDVHYRLIIYVERLANIIIAERVPIYVATVEIAVVELAA